jgi:hypothetical protein
MFQNLSEDNILLYAVKCYDSPNCIVSEFEEDFKRVSYIKRLLKKYRETKELKERLLLNHVVLLQNVFGYIPTTRILFAKVDEQDYSTLKPFLVYTSALPDIVEGIKGKDIIAKDIAMDWDIVARLRGL